MKKKIGKGVLLGFTIPIAFLAILKLVFFIFDKRLTEDVIMSGILFGVGLNALLIRYYFKKDKDYFGRGIMIACFAFCIYWVIQFIR